MSDNFEHLVRSFETGAVTPASTVPVAQIVRPKNVILDIGAGGAAKTMGGSFNFTATFYKINRPTEETSS